MRKHEQSRRAEVLEGAPLRYAPENELGVVFLFSHLARRWRLKVDEIRPQFPDCIAYQKTDRGEKRVRIEFEFRSRNFNHPANKCDWIVCWEHNWPNVPKRLRVVELRKEYGLGFNVWIQPVGPRYFDQLSQINSGWRWSVPLRASKGDLLIYYRTHPAKCIQDIFRHAGNVKPLRASGYRTGFDWFGDIQRVCRLKAPIFLDICNVIAYLEQRGLCGRNCEAERT